MQERIYATAKGDIHYWISETIRQDRRTLVFLPGLTADHRLFERQTAHFAPLYNVLVWDAPGHGASWPFDLSFSLMDEAAWLNEILSACHVETPVLVGQSMGGYVAQAYCQLYPDRISGFVAIDSAPLQRGYTTALEIGLLKRMEPLYRLLPWRLLLRWGSSGVAVSEYGRRLMRDMMSAYTGQQERYARLAGHGYRMLAEAMEADLPYRISCPALLICGEKDRAGSCVRYNRAWHRKASIPLSWIAHAGHNANTDAPEAVNGLLERFAAGLDRPQALTSRPGSPCR